MSELPNGSAGDFGDDVLYQTLRWVEVTTLGELTSLECDGLACLLDQAHTKLR
jgi:hypothetical protein